MTEPNGIPRAPDWTVDTLKQYFDVRVQSITDRLDAADVALVAALDAARREQRLSFDAVERAVDKVETATRIRIDEGDGRLREHVLQQYGQIAAALESARRETQFAHDASQEAINKAEVATEKRFEGVNEFRAQLSDQTTTFLPREVADATFAELRQQVGRLQTRLDTRDGEREARQESRSNVQPIALWAGTSIIALIGLIIVGVGAFT